MLQHRLHLLVVLEAIADEDNFPTTQPASGVVISISDAAGIVVNGSGTATATTAGNGLIT